MHEGLRHEIMTDSAAANIALKMAIRRDALALGFCAVGVTDAEILATMVPSMGDDLDGFLAAGHHGSMDWMARTAARRRHPRSLWSDVESIIVVAMNYGSTEDPLALVSAPLRGAISVHARGEDYHRLFKKTLKQLARHILALAQAHDVVGADLKIFVDTAPVMEKPLAAAAGLGWQGKHTNLVSRDYGSWLFLGEIFTTLRLPSDRPHRDHCGSCRACLDICPTQALPEPYRIDARRCIAYLTIEHDDFIDPELRIAIGNRIYGCDDCLAVCPWNRFAKAAAALTPSRRIELSAPRLADLARLDEEDFRLIFAASGVRRLGWERFMRNVLIAIGNSREPSLVPILQWRLESRSVMVRAMAVWALKCLCSATDFAALRARANESDVDVQREWDRVL